LKKRGNSDCAELFRTPERQNARTPERQNARTPERQNARTPERQNARTPERQNALHISAVAIACNQRGSCDEFMASPCHGQEYLAKNINAETRIFFKLNGSIP
ncbi:MAG: hypothetical protein LBK60_06985, partial [Verrucomicrobiales bacterium]|jgi:hypothetical protein|nr:hypothetical protein [Verrucomicrobiales bacterium]